MGATGSQGLQGPIGATGPAGANGISGYQQETQTATIDSEEVAELTVGCPTSTVVVSGGFSFDTTGISGANIAKVTMIQSFPSSTTSWTVWIANQASVSISATFYAVCAASS